MAQDQNPVVYSLKEIVAEKTPVDQVLPLIAAIKATVNPNEWDVMGGKSTIAPFLPAPDNWWRLIIHCDPHGTHDKIKALLVELAKPARVIQTDEVG